MANPNDFDYLNQVADELQQHVLTLDNAVIESFCGFPIADSGSKEQAVYDTIMQMPDDVLLEYYNEYLG